MSLSEIEQRIAAAKQAVLAETALMHREFGHAKPVIKHDGTKVTPVDIAISQHLQEAITITYALAGHATDGSRFLLRHEVFRADGALAARVTSAGGWLHLDERRLVAPPPVLLAAMNSLDRTDDFAVLPSSLRPREGDQKKPTTR